jgi:nucleoside-diphosphate-sugar epimerase
MLAAAAGRPYRIPFASIATYQHADDVAKAFILAARAKIEEAPVFNLGGIAATTDQVIAAIDQAAPEMAGQITHGDDVMPFPDAIDDSAVEDAIGPIGWRPLDQGVQQTIDDFRAAIKNGTIDVDKAIA